MGEAKKGGTRRTRRETSPTTPSAREQMPAAWSREFSAGNAGLRMYHYPQKREMQFDLEAPFVGDDPLSSGQRFVCANISVEDATAIRDRLDAFIAASGADRPARKPRRKAEGSGEACPKASESAARSLSRRRKVNELRYAGDCWVHDDEDCDVECSMCKWFCPECGDDDVKMYFADEHDTVLQCPECDTKLFVRPSHGEKMTEQNTMPAIADATDPIPSRNPQGIPFRVPTHAELWRYIGDYAEAYAVVEHRSDRAKPHQVKELKRATQCLTTAMGYLYGRMADLERGPSHGDTK